MNDLLFKIQGLTYAFHFPYIQAGFTNLNPSFFSLYNSQQSPVHLFLLLKHLQSEMIPCCKLFAVLSFGVSHRLMQTPPRVKQGLPDVNMLLLFLGSTIFSVECIQLGIRHRRVEEIVKGFPSFLEVLM